MADIELVIKMPEELYRQVKDPSVECGYIATECYNAIYRGTPLPKRHGRLFDEKDIVNGNYEIIGNKIYEAEPIIEADGGDVE